MSIVTLCLSLWHDYLKMFFFPQAFITPEYLGIQVLTGGRMCMSDKRRKEKT